jgi:hypothetical protein
MATLVDGVISMLKGHWFWGALTLICLTWYSTITVYVAIRGARDIQKMLRRLSDSQEQESR